MRLFKKKYILTLLVIFGTTSCVRDVEIDSLSSSSIDDSEISLSSKDNNSSEISSISSSKENSSSELSESTSSSSSSSSDLNVPFDNTLYDGYYKSIDFSLTGEELKTSLFNLIKNPNGVSYDGLKTAYKYTDLREDNTIWDMYSNQSYTFTTDMSKTYSGEGDMYNREHTIPQSIFNKQSPMRSDIYHVYPTDGYVNNKRSNYPHAEVSSASFTSSNGTKVGTSSISGVSGTVCEPSDEYKGDFARTYFYFVTCYQDKLSSFQSYACFSQNSYPSLSKWAINLYLKWSKEDPVSKKETDRVQAVIDNNIQDNRNPFIDYPGLEQYIWNI